MTVELHGYCHSVYSWIARIALYEKGVPYTWLEINPFADDMHESYLTLHPFKRVPALLHNGFALYETSAITRYIDEAFEGPSLQSGKTEERARMNQIISVIDSYAYWPLVRQVFSHGVFRPRMGERVDQAQYQQGLAEAPRVLGALEHLASGENFLVSKTLTLADIHSLPMIAYFTADKNGEALLKTYSKLNAWWTTQSQRQSFVETRPELTEVNAPQPP